jgi:hypothetical protein
MSKYGFVYLLGNPCMPSVYKVGCTERSPRQRAEELSTPTGVPLPFDVLCYMEMEDFQAQERRMHGWLEDVRVSPQREFFRLGNLPYVVGLFKFNPEALSVSIGAALYDGYLNEDAVIPNPWDKKQAESNESPAEAPQEDEVLGDGSNQNDQA